MSKSIASKMQDTKNFLEKHGKSNLNIKQAKEAKVQARLAALASPPDSAK